MNFYEEDSNLQTILKEQFDPPLWEWADEQLQKFGALCAGEIDRRARHTDREGQPKLIKYDKYGEDQSEVWLNEGYKKTIEETYGAGIVGYIHKDIPELGRPGGYVYSFAQGYLLSQAESGFYCPVTLTMATAYLIERYASQELKERYLPHVLSTGEMELYEGATFLTERQGGSDVGANEVKAFSEENHFLIYGEKYFASNAGACGIAMVLARLEDAPSGTKGLSLFLVPWRKDNGDMNGIQIRRLKDKLGVRAVPSAEVEFSGAEAYLVGKPEQGFYYMMEALNLSRVCNATASIGIMRRAYTESLDYAIKREAFGNRLIDFPMIKDTLVRLRVKQEIETRAVFDMISHFEESVSSKSSTPSSEEVMNRLKIAILKKETAEQAIAFAHEAIELHGGNGYIEDFVMPRLLRDAQVLTVWEGTANILGLEVLRLLNKFEAHSFFYEEMTQRLEQVNGFASQVEMVKQEIISLGHQVADILNQSSDIQTYYSKSIARQMAIIYEAVIALEAGKNSGKAEKVAEIYVQLAFGKEQVTGEPLTLRYADELLDLSKSRE
ncbi:isovaleryl-CoA dehydrogenase [Halobacillus halophilus]|uniref:Acyl-CoA dehydrogenase n=1 Tax=Halobacillus halophilus (strain ATCC 35676 / DSM 2266 / JCM 20832 / KCTC 3685 / LMG 17431 / NBRC 102448 / NCIMB 2269) TaxID=866895 RepID=I0JQE8_HALH3|nr:acyl-CoA dehydrogenase family protein [Halobacillus halophilus]ASF40385.1 isovaleryl-CoA dehydrogenase [Halobacillus halophilus]CCG46368.1 putative acyl-CoA dehydrogenase [Halobacillus halophilus DSM 2266]